MKCTCGENYTLVCPDDTEIKLSGYMLVDILSVHINGKGIAEKFAGECYKCTKPKIREIWDNTDSTVSDHY